MVLVFLLTFLSLYLLECLLLWIPKLNAKKTFPHEGKGKEKTPSFGGREESRAL